MHWIALQALLDDAPPDVAAGSAQYPVATEQSALADTTAALGWWALQFTPRVAQVGQTVLLEVSASERLFGGRELLVEQLFKTGRPVARVKQAQAATSLIALALLQADTVGADEPDRLPLATLAEAQAHLSTLERIGCRCWGDLRALPRGRSEERREGKM